MTFNKEYLGAEGYAFMGAVFDVHKELGGGLGEELYHESLEIELGMRNIPYSSKAELEVYYKGHLLRKKYIPDMLVYKVSSEATSYHAMKMHYDINCSGLLSIRSFRHKVPQNGPMESVEWKRFILKTYIPSSFQS